MEANKQYILPQFARIKAGCGVQNLIFNANEWD